MCMTAKSSLDGLTVLVTRPEKQAKNLCTLIENNGGKVIAFPVIDIAPLMPDLSNIDLSVLDMIIFISRNAVDYCPVIIKDNITSSISLVSVGSGSAESMHSHQMRVDLQPAHSTGSDGLLLMPELEDVTDKRILIVRGKGGREHLANTLRQRGATVDYLEVYQRTLPAPSIEQCDEALLADCMVCTSVTGVKNVGLLLEQNLKSITNKPIIVLSERIKDYAVSMGFSVVIVTKDASDTAIIEKLINMESR